MAASFNDASNDTTHANRPTLDVTGTFTGRANNHIDPVYGFTTDFDYFQIDIFDGIDDGPGSIMPGSKFQIKFEPGNAYFYRVGVRFDSDGHLNETTYYPGSTGTMLRHEPNAADINNVYRVPGPLSLNHTRDTDGSVVGSFVLEFEIVAGSAPGGGLLYSPLDYQIKIVGATKPTGKVYNYSDLTDGAANFYDLHQQDRSLSVHGKGGNDFVWGGQRADELYGGLGRDIVIGDNGDDVLYGDNSAESVGHADQLLGGGGSDRAYGAAGNDFINGEWGDDRLYGGAGNDVIFGGWGADVIYGGDGNDRIWASATTSVDGSWFGAAILVDYNGVTGRTMSPMFWTITGEVQLTETAGNKLFGGAGSDLLYGAGGHDLLDGGTGKDTMRGGAGNDICIVDDAGDKVIEAGNAGTDTVRSSVTFTLPINVENLVLTGSGNIAGTGNALANAITGNSGSNVINGRSGNDTLTGGGGKDFFVFDTALNSSRNVDTIADYSVPEDTIRLDNAIFTALTAHGTLSSGGFFIGAAAADSADRIIYNSATGALLYDADGTGSAAAIKFATLAAGLALTHADFVVI